MEQPLYVLFLDIDGVMNVKTVSEQYQFTTTWSEEAVKALTSFIKCTDAKIVLSSSWRFQGKEAIQQLWQEHQLPSEVCT